MRRRCGSWSPAIRWMTGNPSLRWTPASGRATMRKPARDAATITPSSRQAAGQPIVTGWSYAWLAQLSFTHDSWTAPLDVQRVEAGGNAHAVAAAQIAELVERLPANGPGPLSVFDAGYHAEALARELAELDGQHVAVLARLRSDRCFYADPPSP